MVQRWVGADEVIYEEACAEAAEVAAAALPEVRRRTEELVGLTAPPVRVVMTSGPPAVWRYFRPTLPWVGRVLGISAALTLAAAFTGWVIGPAYPPILGVFAAALIISGALFRGHGLVLVLVGVILAGAARPAVIVLSPVLGMAALLVANGYRVRRLWRFVGGFTFAWGRMFRPTIVLHWPPPPRPAAVERLCFQFPSAEDRLRSYLAHEYAHVLLHLRGGRHRPPAWIDEGSAYWLSEQFVGAPMWRPESRDCLSQPEPAKDPRSRFAGQEWYYRLAARHYWEVRALADAGRLTEVLAAPAEELGRLRPSLTTEAERPA
jgi:hypothetical protein